MVNRMINIGAFTILTLLWISFAAALLLNQGMLDSTWEAFSGWPLAMQLLVGLLFLPVVGGLWIWETSWPLLLRLILVMGLAWVTVYTFFPRKLRNESGKAVKNA